MRLDFTPLYRSTIGFDRLFDAFDRQMEASAQPGWPPYNIEKVGDDSYRISLVVAGFAPDEIELIQNGSELTVSGRKNGSDQNTQYLHRGIATRAFKQTFNLADHVKVENAEHQHGVLTIALKQEIPEALKPRRIAISSGGPSQQAPQDNQSERVRLAERAA